MAKKKGPIPSSEDEPEEEPITVPVANGNGTGRKPSLPKILAAGNPIAMEREREIRKEEKAAKSPRKRSSPKHDEEEDHTELLEEYGMAEALKELLDPGDDKNHRKLDARTELNPRQVVVFSKARALAEYYRIPILDKYVTNIQRMNISKGRKSRKEFVSGLQSSLYGSDEVRASGLRGLGDRFRQ
jgi:hypothetical protein